MKLFLKLRKQRRRPAEMLLNGLTRKCSSEHRRGRGTLQRKVGKRLPQGPQKRRGGASARCRRHRSSGDARRRRRRSRLAPERGCHGVSGVEKMRLLRKRRGPGICPVKKVEVPGFEPGQTEPKSVVLPLHHTSIPDCKYNNYSHPRRHLRPLPPDNMLKHSGKAALLRAPLPDFPDTASRLAAHRLALKYELTSSEHSPERTPDTVTVLGCRIDGEKREKPRLGSAAP